MGVPILHVTAVQATAGQPIVILAVVLVGHGIAAHVLHPAQVPAQTLAAGLPRAAYVLVVEVGLSPIADGAAVAIILS